MWRQLNSDEQAAMLSDNKNLDLWCFFVAGAPGFLDSNIQPSRGLANGSPFKFHSLTYSSEDDSAAVHAFAQNRGNRLVLTMPSPPQFVNIIIQRGNNSESGLNIPLGDVLVNPETEVIVPIALSKWTSTAEAVPLEDQARPWELSVKAFPLQLGFALTFHKVQSKTIAKGILVLGERSFLPQINLPMLFVGMSRFKSSKDMRVLDPVGKDFLYLLNLKPDPIIDHWLSGIQVDGTWQRATNCPWKNRAEYKKSLKSKSVKANKSAGKVKSKTAKASNALSSVPSSVVLESQAQQLCVRVYGFELSMRTRDICANPRGWFNDELIDFCMKSQANQLFPDSESVPSQPLPQVCVLRCSEVRRGIGTHEDRDLIQKFGRLSASAIVIVPLNHDDIHWSVAIVSWENRVIYHLDSLPLESGERGELQWLSGLIDGLNCAAAVNLSSVIRLETTRQPNE